VVKFIDKHDIDLLIYWCHDMLKIPSSAASQLGNNDITISKKVDVEIYVMNWLERVSAGCQRPVLGMLTSLEM